MKRIITLCSLCAIMLLTPDKAEAQFLKKLGKAVNEVSNAIGKNDKKSSRKQKESTSRRSDSGSADSDMNSPETGNQSYGDEYVYVSIYEGKLKKGNLFSLSYEPEKYFSGYKVTPSTKTIYYDGSRGCVVIKVYGAASLFAGLRIGYFSGD